MDIERKRFDLPLKKAKQKHSVQARKIKSKRKDKMNFLPNGINKGLLHS